MQKAPLAVGIVLGLGTVSLLAGVLKHHLHAPLSLETTVGESSPAIVACSSTGACAIAPFAPAVDTERTTATASISPPALTSVLAPALSSAFELVFSDKLPENEFVTIPGRDAPIERWKAQRYFCPGDFNRDDVIDEKDITDYLEASATMSGPLAEFLDINHDGVVDASDLQALVDATFADCDPSLTAQNRHLICLADPQDQEDFARFVFAANDGC